jgi:hypothetical protein
MKRLTALCATLLVFAAATAYAAPVTGLDVTDPADTIALVNGQNDGDPDSGPPPANEGVENAINNDDANKYLNFLDLNSGFQVTLDAYGPAELIGIALTTANDSPPRDPASVTITGSNDGTNWFPIVTDLATPLSDDRFTESAFYFTPETGGAYSMYEVIFPTLKDAAAANSMQIGEVRLLPEPATLALVGFGAAAAALGRRKRG